MRDKIQLVYAPRITQNEQHSDTSIILYFGAKVIHLSEYTQHRVSIKNIKSYTRILVKLLETLLLIFIWLARNKVS